MEDISSKVTRGTLCDMREQNLRPTDIKSTGQALYRERRKAYTDNPKAWNDVCDAFVVVDVKPRTGINFES